MFEFDLYKEKVRIFTTFGQNTNSFLVRVAGVEPTASWTRNLWCIYQNVLFRIILYHFARLRRNAYSDFLQKKPATHWGALLRNFFVFVRTFVRTFLEELSNSVSHLHLLGEVQVTVDIHCGTDITMPKPLLHMLHAVSI